VEEVIQVIQGGQVVEMEEAAAAAAEEMEAVVVNGVVDGCNTKID
jgi:hypothetical protein